MFRTAARSYLHFLLRTPFIIILLIVIALHLSPSAGQAFSGYFQSGDLVIESEKVCSPGTHNKCLPGPFSKTVEVPEGVSGVEIEVSWLSTGEEDQQQPNEHSNFTANHGLGEIYCPDFGFSNDKPISCGSVSGEVAPGDSLKLTIQHADESQGPTPGSHRQIWVIHWVRSAAPSATATLPPAASDTPVPPAETAVPTPTGTSEVLPPGPTASATPETASPTPTSTVPAEEPPAPSYTPTATPEVLPPEPSATPLQPTPTEPEEEPENPPRPTRTSTPQVSSPGGQPPAATRPAATATPAFILPVTGGDQTVAASGLAWKLVLAGAGLFLAGFGFWRERRR